MKIIVCVKRVPDTETKVKVGPEGVTIDPAGVNYVLNPYDEFALEEGLRIKEKFGGEVAVLSLGPEEVRETLRTALAMGADRALHLRTEAPVVDPLSIAWGIAEALRGGGWDLLLFGKQSVDYDNSQVGTMVAELLGIPSASVVVQVEIGEGHAVVHREVEGGHEVVELPLPAALTAQKGLNEPRYASLKGIMAAKRKEIAERPAVLPEPGLTALRMDYPPTRPSGRIIGEGAAAVPELVRLLREEAKVL